MSLKELRTIVNNLDMDEKHTNVRVKINYPDGVSYWVTGIDSFKFMNGDLVLNVKSDVR